MFTILMLRPRFLNKALIHVLRHAIFCSKAPMVQYEAERMAGKLYLALSLSTLRRHTYSTYLVYLTSLLEIA